MGLFTFNCSHCSKPILSQIHSGENAFLAFLQDGELMEMMGGEYTGYGTTFKYPSKLSRKQQEWSLGWEMISDLHHGDDPSTGILAMHHECAFNSDVSILDFKTKSENAPQVINGTPFWQMDFGHYTDYPTRHWVTPDHPLATYEEYELPRN